MIGTWNIRYLPRCTHHVFLSHCAEDRTSLIQPVYNLLEEDQYFPWLDRHHYPRGRDSFSALREGIVLCRHVVYFITEEFLLQGRGWNSIETAYADLLQKRFLQYDLELCNIQFPLFFVPQSHCILHRSAWGPLIQRGKFYSPGEVDDKATSWATSEIKSFIRQEEIRGLSLAEQIQIDPSFKSALREEKNLLSRVMCADPPLRERID